MAHRVYVPVDVRYLESGQIELKAIIWTDGRTYDIDKTLKIEKAHAPDAGGHGTKYTFSCRGQVRAVFRQMDDRWFVVEAGE